MSARATTARPEPDDSYSCDFATQLSKPIDITDPYSRITTYQYSFDRPPRSRRATTTKKDRSSTSTGPTAGTSDSVQAVIAARAGPLTKPAIEENAKRML
jgi:hypothetical protein